MVLIWKIWFNFLPFCSYGIPHVALPSNTINPYKPTTIVTNPVDNWNTLASITKEQFECSPFFCLNVICKPITECVNGEIVPNASFCGCCDKCIVYNNENRPCDDISKTPLGGKPQRQCKIGLTCENSICMKRDDSCEVIIKRRKALKDRPDFFKIPFSKELWIPNCDNVGRFRGKQCKSKKCICVDENGTTLFGQEEKDLAQNMTCGCARSMKELEISDPDRWMTRTQEHCTNTGDYQSLQCVNNLCYCSDSVSGEVQNRVVTKQLMEFLPCYDSKEIGIRYETQCDIQLMRTRSLRYQFYRKNINIADLEDETCALDGSFGAKQCLTDRCVCTDRKGLGIKSYYVEKIARNEEFMMTCNCARDEYDNEALHARYPRMVCEGNGNFQHLQCFGTNSCYCVDEDGDFITEKFTQELALSVQCLDILEILNDINIDILYTNDSKNS